MAIVTMIFFGYTWLQDFVQFCVFVFCKISYSLLAASLSLYGMFSTVQRLTSILKVQNNLAKMIYQPGHTQLTLDILLILLSQ